MPITHKRNIDSSLGIHAALCTLEHDKKLFWIHLT